MLSSIRHAALSAFRRQIDRFFFFPPVAPQLSLAGIHLDVPSSTDDDELGNSALEDSLWFAVPKKKISKSRKRKKTTLQKAIKAKTNIVVDRRTGELTLKHKLPYNWINYLPGNAEYAPPPNMGSARRDGN